MVTVVGKFMQHLVDLVRVAGPVVADEALDAALGGACSTAARVYLASATLRRCQAPTAAAHNDSAIDALDKHGGGGSGSAGDGAA